MITDTSHLLAIKISTPPKKDRRGIIFAVGATLLLLVSAVLIIPQTTTRKTLVTNMKSQAGTGSGWPVIPTPSDGQTGVSLSPVFSWNYETPSNTSCNAAGSYANVYLWDCSAGNDSCLIGFGGRSSDTESIYSVPSTEVHPYYAPGKPDYSKSVAPLTPNKQYWWYATPKACGLLHFEENKRWTFTTGSAAPTPTLTPTPTPAAQCQRIKAYKGDVVVTDLTTLRAGDQVTIAVVGANATKARIRVNGAAYVETTTKNAAGEYTTAFTIPSSIQSFTIEAEVYQNGIWQ